ncbi:MAG TPA: CHAT domain-containing protein [Saprospiraceae bacterium]|nr:CHAT domain-containing protein [Saprospiraceae bacterium]
MEVLLLAFANSREHPLPTLAGEYTALNKILSPRVLRQHFLSWSVSHATLEDIGHYLTLFRDRLGLFLFSGHAGRDVLLTEDGASRAGGIAHLLGQCKNLKVVVLNGCSTAGQVEALHAAGVPLVIATSAPVGDEIAAQFSARLFQALETGLSIGEAFEQAIGEAQARQELKVDRSVGRRPDSKPDEPLWGLKPHPDKPDAAGWKLPVQAVRPANLQHEPNELLLETLYDTFAQTNPRVRELREEGATLQNKRRKIKNALEDALPAPISEHLRKLLLTSLPGEEEGYDKTGPRRLDQLARTYQISMDFLLYVILAQVWEIYIAAGAQYSLAPEIQNSVYEFLRLDVSERRNCDYFSVLNQLTGAFKPDDYKLFVPELTQLRDDLADNDDVKNACFFLETLRRQSETAGAAEIPELCARAEESLALIFSKLGFLGQYFVATVRNIGVVKHRHIRKAEFEHMVVVWHGTQGDCESDTVRHPEFLDNRSVVLLRLADDPEDTMLLRPDEKPENRFLNLSPFILDENTFEAVPTNTVSKLFLFAGSGADGHLLYKYVNKPETEVIDLDDPAFFEKSTGTTKFQLAKVQFEAFQSSIFNRKPNPVEP